VADIFKEVDEDLRQEHYKKLWDKYGRYVIGAAVALVLAVGGYQGWQAWDRSQREEQSARYAAAMALAEDGQTAEAQAALAAFGGPEAGGYALLASFQEARLKADAGDLAGAVAIWDRIASDPDVGQAFQGAATLLSVIHQLEGETQAGDPAQLQARLDPLLDSGSAYRPLALELSGLLSLRAGDVDAARARFQEIGEEAGASQGVRARATQMLAVLGEGE
jgi:hypothetical protein